MKLGKPKQYAKFLMESNRVIHADVCACRKRRRNCCSKCQRVGKAKVFEHNQITVVQNGESREMDSFG